jgi:hypothetical protein
MNKKTYVLKAESGMYRVSPFGFYKYAKEFFDAGEIYEESIKDRKGFSPVPYYLYCRSIELMLKSILLYCDPKFTENKLKKEYGHDLIKILNAAEILLKSKLLNNEEQMVIKKANDYYQDKGFEYFKVDKAVQGYKDLPELSQLKEITQKLLKNPVSKKYLE